MMATLLRHECPLMVILTAGRLPLPSASTTSGGISKPLMGSGGSTWVRNFIVWLLPFCVGSPYGRTAPPGSRRLLSLLRVRLVLSPGAVADVPDVSVRIRE